jgi:prevent-host-death family protein
MVRSLSLAEAKAHFSECVRDAEDGSPVLVMRHGKAVAAIVPAADLDTLQRLRSAGPAGGLASLAGRFDDVQEFVDAVEAIARNRPRSPAPDLDE